MQKYGCYTLQVDFMQKYGHCVLQVGVVQKYSGYILQVDVVGRWLQARAITLNHLHVRRRRPMMVLALGKFVHRECRRRALTVHGKCRRHILIEMMVRHP